MKKRFFLAFALLAGLAMLMNQGCQPEELTSAPEFITSITVTMEQPDFSPIGGPETKVKYTVSGSSVNIEWTKDDVVGIYPLGGDQVAFPLSGVSSGSAAKFDGGAWALRSSFEYAAYYPFNKDYYDKEEISLPISFKGQRQKGNNSLDHLGRASHMMSAATRPDSKGNVTINLKQVGTWVQLRANLPAGMQVSGVKLLDHTADLIVGGTIDLSQGTESGDFEPRINNPEYSSSITLDVEDLTVGAEVVKFWLMLPPQDLTGHNLELQVASPEGDVISNTTTGAAIVRAIPKVLNFGTISEDAATDYLSFTAKKANSTIAMEMVGEEWDIIRPTFEFSLDGKTWENFTIGTTTVTLTNIGDKVYFRGKNIRVSQDLRNYVKFVMTGKVAAGGNIMSLVDNRAWTESVPGAYAFNSMFLNCTALTSAPALPAKNLTEYCYAHMFCGCTNLLSAPSLPATIMTPYCYYRMFQGCSSLKSCPDLPATSLAESCYRNMFRECTTLTAAPALPAADMEPSCYRQMFRGCSNLKTAPELSSMNLADFCYDQMFCFCSSLTTPPDLPAMEMASYCYFEMFNGCTTLASAPALPATKLADYCYRSMFHGCTGLKSAPALPATALATECYYCMFYNCTSLAKAPDLPATTMAEGCYRGMFENCTSLTTAPALPATTLAESCYRGMFYDCASLAVTPSLPATTMKDYCYMGMFRGCTNMAAAPSLPATTLAEYCYDAMFYECAGLTKAPALPATKLAVGCYFSMFGHCTGLVTAPTLPATTLVSDCYHGMFNGCSKLKKVQVGFKAWNDAGSSTTSWLSGVLSTGTFVCPTGLAETRNASHIPSGWTITH